MDARNMVDLSGAVDWWNEWQLRVLALGSLCAQYLLAFLGRKRDLVSQPGGDSQSGSRTWRPMLWQYTPLLHSSITETGCIPILRRTVTTIWRCCGLLSS